MAPRKALPYTLYDRFAFMKLDLTVDWHVDWLRLDTSSKIIPQFRPGLVDATDGCFPSADGAFWSSSPQARNAPMKMDEAASDDEMMDGDGGDEAAPNDGDDEAQMSDDGSSENAWDFEDRAAFG